MQFDNPFAQIDLEFYHNEFLELAQRAYENLTLQCARKIVDSILQRKSMFELKTSVQYHNRLKFLETSQHAAGIRKWDTLPVILGHCCCVTVTHFCHRSRYCWPRISVINDLLRIANNMHKKYKSHQTNHIKSIPGNLDIPMFHTGKILPCDPKSNEIF